MVSLRPTVGKKSINVDFSKYYTPKEKQIIAHRSIAKYLLFGGALGGGKSYWLCAEGITHCIKFPGARAVIIRKERTVILETIWVTFHKICPPELIASTDKSRLAVTFINGSEIRFMQADIAKDPLLNKIKGLEISWFGIDEANELEEMVFKMLKTRLRWILPNGIIPRYEGRLTSNPENCWLIPVFIENDDPEHLYVESLTSDNYDVNSEYYQILEQAFADDPELRQKYLFARWDLVDKINQLINGEAIKKSESFAENGWGTGLGVDPARFGKDETSFVYVEDGQVILTEGYQGWSIDKTVDHTISLINQFNLDASNVGVDGVGIGAGVVDYLHRGGYMVQDLVGGASVDPERIDIGVFKPFNLRSQMYWALRQDIITGQLGSITDSILARQLGWIQYDVATEKTLRVASKEAIKKIHAKSPDRADALVYANWVKRRRARYGGHIPISAGE